MFALVHPEVLSIDWLPPTLVGRGIALLQAERLLATDPGGGRTRMLAIEGPKGAGTSVVARRTLRNFRERASRHPDPQELRILSVRVRSGQATSVVAATLLQHFDPEFSHRGFPSMEILAGCLRRIKREGRPAAILLDDLDSGAPFLASFVRALAQPERFLPEGDEGMPPLTVLLAGTATAMNRIRRASGLPAARVVLPGYTASELRTIVSERIGRALGRDAPAALVASIVERTMGEGGSASRALDLIRRELIGDAAARAGSVFRPWGVGRQILVEDHLVRAIGLATRAGVPTVAVVRRCERAVAHDLGLAPLPATTFWRRIVRLEEAGYVRREVRTGGPGGTESKVHLLLPVAEWVTIPRARGTPRGCAPSFSGGREKPVVGPVLSA